MTTVLTSAAMRDADARTIASGVSSRTLMERAASEALDVLFAHFDTTRVVFFCGSGNNGGDGLAMARFFYEKAGYASICYTGVLDVDGAPDRAQMSKECARQFDLLPSGITLSTTPSLRGATAVVDAMLGIGLSRPVTGALYETIGAINAARVPVLAIDVPSGVDATSGAVCGIAVKATHTVTMSALKSGLLLYPAAALCGDITVADIGITLPDSNIYRLDREDLNALPSRPARSHKGTFGRVLIVGGAVGMSGAAYLAAKAAYRTGAGLVEILAPEENRVIYQTQLPEAVLTLYDRQALDESLLLSAIARADAIAIGMGLGDGDHVTSLIRTVLSHGRAPLLLDADALNALSRHKELATALALYGDQTVITPHLGEMSRLEGRAIPEISQNVCATAAEMAERLNTTVVLKDARTVICDGAHLAINCYGNDGMATAGSGDVLAGVIAALLAAGDERAAEHGVLVHALAGDAAAERVGRHGLMASDIIDGLCHVLP